MQDLDDNPPLGRRRLSAIQGERGTPPVTTEDASVVSAQRLLKVATALSDGATKLHAQLRHLEPAERDAILDLVAEQVTEIVTLWADLVRGVVSTDEASPTDAPAAAEKAGPRASTSFAAQRQNHGAGDHPARVTTPEPVAAPATTPKAVPEPAHQLSEPASPTVLRHVPMDSGRDS